MKKTRKLKLRQVLKILSIVILLITFLISLYVNFFVLNRIKDDEIDRENSVLTHNMDICNRTIKYELTFMYDYLTDNENIARINIAGSDSDIFYALQQVQYDLQNFSDQHYGMEHIFFFTEKDSRNGYVSTRLNNTPLSMLTRDLDLMLISLGEEDNSIGSWTFREVNGKNLLVFILKKGRNYIGCWCTVNYLLQDFINDDNRSFGEYTVFLTDEYGVSKTDSYLNGLQIDLEAKEGHDPETGENYRQLVQRSDMIPVCFAERIDQTAIETAVWYMRSTMIITGLVFITIIALWSGLLSKLLYSPIKVLVAKMTQLSTGDLDTRITEQSRFSETTMMYDSFNNMVEEIRDLKIAVYERELFIKKTDIEHIKLQIHPHFLVNGINSAIAMIDMKKYDAAKEMCAYLAEYYRYQFQHIDGLVSLKDELRQIQLFMVIQEMRHPGKLNYFSEVDDACMSLSVPPFSILTFVNNSVKYGMNLTTYKTDISVQIRRTSDGSLITIRDRGPGFPDEIFDCINNRRPIYQKGRECIGLRNTIVRFALFYDEKASLHAYNDGGAVIEIMIPDKAIPDSSVPPHQE